MKATSNNSRIRSMSDSRLGGVLGLRERSCQLCMTKGTLSQPRYDPPCGRHTVQLYLAVSTSSMAAEGQHRCKPCLRRRIGLEGKAEYKYINFPPSSPTSINIGSLLCIFTLFASSSDSAFPQNVLRNLSLDCVRYLRGFD